MEKEISLDFSDDYLKTIIDVSHEPKKRVVIGFNENQFGEVVVTIAVTVQTQPDKVSYVKEKIVI